MHAGSTKKKPIILCVKKCIYNFDEKKKSKPSNSTEYHVFFYVENTQY